MDLGERGSIGAKCGYLGGGIPPGLEPVGVVMPGSGAVEEAVAVVGLGGLSPPGFEDGP